MQRQKIEIQNTEIYAGLHPWSVLVQRYSCAVKHGGAMKKYWGPNNGFGAI